MMSVSSVALIACWGGFIVVWIVGAVYNARHGPGVRERERGRSWIVAVAALWLLYGHVAGIDWHRLELSSPWLEGAGIALLVASTAFTLWARFVLGTMWSAAVAEKTDHELRTDGPYAVTRHPIYTGVLGMLLATALIDDLGRAGAVFVLGAVYFAWKASAEERLLGRSFPEYERYRQRVPRLLPLPRPRRPASLGRG